MRGSRPGLAADRGLTCVCNQPYVDDGPGEFRFRLNVVESGETVRVGREPELVQERQRDA